MKKLLLLIAVFSFAGAQDYSLQFDGVDDYVSIGTSGILNSGNNTDIGSLLGDGSFSISLWFYPISIKRCQANGYQSG